MAAPAASSAPAAPTAAPAPAALARLPGTPDASSDGTYVFSAAGIELVVDPRRDGNAVRLSLEGKNVLASPAPGTTTYAAEVQGSSLLLKSPDGALSKRYRLDIGRRAVEISYSLNNATSEPWQGQVSEAHELSLSSGLTFFPNPPQQPLVWFVHQPLRAAPVVKATVGAGQSWIASVLEDVLFVRVYPNPSPTALTLASQYDAKTRERPWLETLAQSSTFELPPGTFATWNVRWLLRRLPSSITVRPGNPELVGFVKGVIQ